MLRAVGRDVRGDASSASGAPRCGKTRLAIARDAELDELEGDAQEKRLLELARFELLNPSEQSIYKMNGGSPRRRSRPPVAGWKKYVFGVVMLTLLVIPTLFLLLFGVQQGKKTTKSWWVGTMTCFALEWFIYEPLQIGFLFVFLPSLVRSRLKRLVDPTQIVRFPFKTPLYEQPTTYLAAHSGLVARRMLKRRALRRTKATAGARSVAEAAAMAEVRTDDDDGTRNGGLASEAAGVVMRLVQHRATFGARMMIGFWTILILMPPELQEMVIMDSLAIATVGALFVIQFVNRLDWVGRGFCIAMNALSIFAVFAYCAHRRGGVKPVDDADDDEDDEEEEEDDDEEDRGDKKEGDAEEREPSR